MSRADTYKTTDEIYTYLGDCEDGRLVKDNVLQPILLGKRLEKGDLKGEGPTLVAFKDLMYSNEPALTESIQVL